MNKFNKTKTLALSLAIISAGAVSTAHAEDKGEIKSVKQAPVAQQPIKQEPIKQEPVKQNPVVAQLPAKQEPVKQLPPVAQLPAKQEPVKQLPPVAQLPAKQEPVKQLPPVAQLPAKQEPVKQMPVTQQPPLKQAPVVQESGKQAPIAQESNKLETGEKGVSAEEKWSTFFSVAHQANVYAHNTIELARTSSDSELVRNYATEMGKRHEAANAALSASASKFGFSVRALNNNEGVGMIMLARANGETELLRSLTGEAFNQEFLTRVISCQSQAIHTLQKRIATAPSAEMKAFLDETIKSLIIERDSAQALLDKICDVKSRR